MDNCQNRNPSQADRDNDGFGDVCDKDDDNDGVLDVFDNCVTVANPDQANSMVSDGGDLCDLDDDNDGIVDTEMTVLEILGCSKLRPG